MENEVAKETGRHPFEARNSPSQMSAILEAHPVAPSMRKSGLPVIFDEVVLKALAKAPQMRYSSMQELMDILRKVSADEHALSHSSEAGDGKKTSVLLHVLGWSVAALLLMALSYWLIGTVFR